jgi:hypothetical protein
VSWETVSALATAIGTLVLAVATFASVRSANRSARSAEDALLVGLRPVLMPTRIQDPAEKIGFQDGHWIKVDGGRGHAECIGDVIYLAMSLRNVGSGLAVLRGWLFRPERVAGDTRRPDLAGFRRLTRDIYVPAGDQGFWQGTFRDPSDPAFGEACDTLQRADGFMIDLLYGDHEGGQRVISRFALVPHDGTYLTAVSQHWNLDRGQPR